MPPLVSIISVNYNGLTLTCALIDSLRAHLTLPFELIVVDNGSRENEAAVLRQKYPEITVLRSDRNLGFAGGNNLGLRVARGEYVFLLNNDTELEEDTLGFLCETLRTRPEVGAVCPKIRFFNPPRLIQFAGYTPLSQITLRNALIGFNSPDNGSFDTPHDTPYAHGAAMMVRRSILAQVGLMPECYFLYYEELDWSVRITEKGYKIAYDPRCTVYHKESGTTGQQSPLRTFYITRNRLLFGWRNRHGVVRYLAVLYQIGVVIPKNILVTLLHGRRDLMRATWRGVGAFFLLKNKTT
ncbi:MAG: glycosyltransferase family 2 protein [Alistipes sp.]